MFSFKTISRGQDGGGVGGHARPLPQTQQKKHIYRINDSHRTATNRWQRNLNSNNGKKFVTLLGRTGEKRRVREGESEWTGAPERELRRRKGSRTLESHLPGERSNEPEESPDAERSVAVSRNTEKPIKNPTDHLNYGHSHQKLRRLGGGWAPNPRLQRLVPGKGPGDAWVGLGTVTSALKVGPREGAGGRLGWGWAPRPRLRRLVPKKGPGGAAWVGAGHRDLGSRD